MYKFLGFYPTTPTTRFIQKQIPEKATQIRVKQSLLSEFGDIY